MNCQTDCGLKMEPHPGLDSLSPPDTMFILATSHASSLPEVSVPPPDMRAHPCSTIKVSTHRGRPAQCPAETRLNSLRDVDYVNYSAVK